MARTVLSAGAAGRLDGDALVLVYPGETGIADTDTLTATRTERDASTTLDVTDLMVAGGFVGFEVGVEKTQVPRWAGGGLGRKLPTTVSGPSTVNANPQLITKAARNGVDLRDHLDQGDTFFLEINPDGDTGGSYSHTYQFEVANVSPTKDTGDFQRVVFDLNLLDSNERTLIPSTVAPTDWTMQITGTPAGGTYTLTVLVDSTGISQTTAAIAYNATGATIEAALEALSNVAPGDVEVSDGAMGTLLTLEWAYNVTMTHTDSFTGGTSPTVVLTEVAD